METQIELTFVVVLLLSTSILNAALSRCLFWFYGFQRQFEVIDNNHYRPMQLVELHVIVLQNK